METVGITVAATHIEGQNLKYIVFVCLCVCVYTGVFLLCR